MSNAKNIVTAFLEALNHEDFKTARQYVSDDMKFEGVMGSRNGAEAYFKDMAHMKFKYTIKHLFTDGDDVSVFYDIDMGGHIIFSSGWYKVSNGKINWIKVLFDPRPLLETKDKK
jgi:limonene-1,2-epoxide hydrolase